MLETELTVTLERPASACVVLRVVGAVDLHTADHLRTAVQRALDERPGLLVLDLDGVHFLSSAGLSVLVAAHNGGEDATALRVVANLPVAQRPLELTGLSEVLNLYPSVDAACEPAAVSPVPPPRRVR